MTVRRQRPIAMSTSPRLGLAIAVLGATWCVVAFLLVPELIRAAHAGRLEVERPLGILDPIVRTFTGGFALPALNTLSQTTGQYGDFFSKGVTPLALFVLAGAVIYGRWSPRLRRVEPL